MSSKKDIAMIRKRPRRDGRVIQEASREKTGRLWNEALLGFLGTTAMRMTRRKHETGG